MAELNEKQKLYILFGIGGIVVFIIYYSFLLKPQFSNFAAMNREFSVIRASVKNAETLIINEGRIKKQYEELKKQSELFEKKLSLQDEISSLLGDFSRVAESSGVKILKIKPLESFDDVSDVSAAGSEIYSEFPILIEARAGYHQCREFFSKLENMDRFIRINDIDIKGRQGDPRRHDIRLKVSTYIMR